MFDGISAQKNLVCQHLGELPQIAEQIIEAAGDIKVWLFEGDMGAGKTTLIKALCKAFGVKDTVTSPTFSLVNEYKNHDGSTFYHFDFYRIKNETEAMDIGAEEYFYSGNVCFIEWSSKIPNLIPDTHLSIYIEVNPDHSRRIAIVKNGESV